MELKVHYSTGLPELYVRRTDGLGTAFSLLIQRGCQVALARACLLDSLNNGDRDGAMEMIAEIMEAARG
jgi:hypothetical protein